MSISISQARRGPAANECHAELFVALAAIYSRYRDRWQPAYVRGTTAARLRMAGLGRARAVALFGAIAGTAGETAISDAVCRRLCVLDDDASMAAAAPSAHEYRLGCALSLPRDIFARFRRAGARCDLSAFVAPVVGCANRMDRSRTRASALVDRLFVRVARSHASEMAVRDSDQRPFRRVRRRLPDHARRGVCHT